MNTQNNNNLIKKLTFVIAINVMLMPMANALTYQSHNSIYYAAKQFVNNKVVQHDDNKKSVVKLGKLDSRLKLKKCSSYLRAFMPKGSRDTGKTTIGVKCTGVNPWSLHVPVTISVFKDVLVASKQLQRGKVLKASDVKLKSFDVSSLPYGFLEDINSGKGMKLKRRVLSGVVITPAMLKKPTRISRGQQVTILAQSDRMEVRMEGKALANGAIGDRIRVMNVKSKQKLEGVIMKTGEVKVKI